MRQRVHNEWFALLAKTTCPCGAKHTQVFSWGEYHSTRYRVIDYFLSSVLRGASDPPTARSRCSLWVHVFTQRTPWSSHPRVDQDARPTVFGSYLNGFNVQRSVVAGSLTGKMRCPREQ